MIIGVIDEKYEWAWGQSGVDKGGQARYTIKACCSMANKNNQRPEGNFW